MFRVLLVMHQYLPGFNQTPLLFPVSYNWVCPPATLLETMVSYAKMNSAAISSYE